MSEDQRKFIIRVLRVTEDFPGDLEWSVCDEQVRFYVNCNDFFAWGCSDLEEVTEDNIDLLEKSIEDDEISGGYLFCCRARSRRPMSYDYINQDVRHLFDECEPSKPVA